MDIAKRTGFSYCELITSTFLVLLSFCGHYRSIDSIIANCDVIGQQSYRILRTKHKIRAITPFKVIQSEE